MDQIKRHQTKMRFKSNNSAEEKPQFNQAALFIERLDNLEGMVDELVANNQLTLAIDLVKRVIVRIRPLAEEKEVSFSKVDEHLEELNGLYSEGTSKLNPSVIKEKFFALDQEVWNLQHKLHLIMPHREAKSWQKEVQEDFE